MNLEQFSRLDFEDKANAVFGREDCFLSFRLEGAYTMLLYDMGDFFAEVWYHGKKNEVDRIEGFGRKEVGRLEPYLPFISLRELE
jgi:hypothetical protein